MEVTLEMFPANYEHLKKSIECSISPSLQFKSGCKEDDDVFDPQILSTLSLYYDDTEPESLGETHIPPSSSLMASVGFSSILKWSHIISVNNIHIGKVVITLKRNNTAKIGPIFILPTFRNKGYANKALRLLTTFLLSNNIIYIANVFATVTEHNYAAIAAFSNAGFLLSHSLRRHYNRNCDELVFYYNSCQPIVSEISTPSEVFDLTNCTLGNASLLLVRWTSSHYFPVDANWLSWLEHVSNYDITYNTKGHDILTSGSDNDIVSTLLIYKRNRTLKAIISFSVSDPFLFNEAISSVLNCAVSGNFSKLSFFIPDQSLTVDLDRALTAFNILKEVTLPIYQYSIYDSVSLYSVNI